MDIIDIDRVGLICLKDNFILLFMRPETMRENIKVLRHFLAMCEGQILYDEIQREIDHKVVKRKPKDTSNAIPFQIKRKKKEDYGFES